jgi:hypothetical protein
MDDEEGGSEEEEAVNGEDGVEVVDEDRVCGDMQSVSSFIAFFLQKFLVVVGLFMMPCACLFVCMNVHFMYVHVYVCVLL